MQSHHPAPPKKRLSKLAVREALELQQLYQQLETSLAKPGRLLDVGDAYRQSLGKLGKGCGEILGRK